MEEQAERKESLAEPYGAVLERSPYRELEQEKQEAPVRPYGQTGANWGMGARHTLFPGCRH